MCRNDSTLKLVFLAGDTFEIFGCPARAETFGLLINLWPLEEMRYIRALIRRRKRKFGVRRYVMTTLARLNETLTRTV